MHSNDLQPAGYQKTPTRADLEKRLLQINADMAALTPQGFGMPDTDYLKSADQLSPLQARLKKNELNLPDTEVLRQLLMEKARIAEQLDVLPNRAEGVNRPKNDFSVKAKNPTLR